MTWWAFAPMIYNAIAGRKDTIGKGGFTATGFYDPTGENQTGYDATKYVMPTSAGLSDKKEATSDAYNKIAMAAPSDTVSKQPVSRKGLARGA